MSLGDPCVECERGAKRRRPRWLTPQMPTCSVALVVVAIAGGCGAGSHSKAVSATDAVTIVEHTAVVPPTTPGGKWPKAPTSSSPYSKAGGADVTAPDDPLTAKLYRRLRGLDLIGSAGSRWDGARLGHPVGEKGDFASDAHPGLSGLR